MSYQTQTTTTSSSPSQNSTITEDEEDWEDYVKGGYHPVHLGDTFSDGRYVVVRKLGWGHFSTVWLARDEKMNRHVALKVVKSAARYTETALDEIKLLQRLIAPSGSSSSGTLHPGRSHVISFLDHFRHRGPNGTHICMVFEVLGENLLGLIKRHQSKGVPMGLVRQIAKQVLLGLDYMHRECGVVHTDLKPENVLVVIEDVEGVVEDELRKAAASVGSSPANPNPSSYPAGPNRIIGVPPSTGRGGNQTPRTESLSNLVQITSSQPLPSPSSSFGSSSFLSSLAQAGGSLPRMAGSGSSSSGTGPGRSTSTGNTSASPASGAALDRFAFGMSRIDSEIAEGVGNVSLESTEGSNATAEEGEEDGEDGDGDVLEFSTKKARVSLLTQQAPSHAADAPGSAMDPSQLAITKDASASYLGGVGGVGTGLGVEGMGEERITVKIADLGNVDGL
ncbi:kinase-like protein [Gymnopus androsaceus JB14]|uniref:non-specific serine/threonine protein kinase n=1 Tax=Gymnopus androsaceus JB14 TaxID=1447944 RepID=A0A6A4HFZ4_9AGAR|nr:kinase-like protein [Gymnopus androsaceus JB14]